MGVIPEVLLVADEDNGDVGAEVTYLGGPNLGDVLLKKTRKISHTVLFNFHKYKHRRGMKLIKNIIERMLHIGGWVEINVKHGRS